MAGGVQQAGKKPEEAKEEESDDEKPTTSFKLKNSSSDEDEPPRPGTVTKNLTCNYFGVLGFGGTDSGDIAGLRSKSNTQATNFKGMGNWEKHTKGIGAKLLLQMGFQPGKGLGKDLQGISAPVEAHLRKGRGAIGAYGPEKAASIPKKKVKLHLPALINNSFLVL